MARRPSVARNIAALRNSVAGYRKKGVTVALVPTMGALHDGHLSLVRAARKKAKRVVVSIFVNPAQFAPTEDFSTYPRTWSADIAALAALGVDLVWAPSAAVMYPEGFSTRLEPGGPAKVGLEDRFRPHFFGGVTTVVSKLFIQVAPDIAVFGQKDYQQLMVVTRMARDLDLPLKVVGIPTVREKDGLAMSSRNVYLSPPERATAPTLYRTLKECATNLRSGQPLERALSGARATIEQAGFAIDYVEARHAQSLAPIASLDEGPVRLLVAARLGRTRLIDNIAV
ncbi:MAG: pantoate--beta-alanine ligase [Pseudorhodoplanes sp.]|nr:Pantothenate synthetase [Pseudorhodoplanes sp.]MBW7949421.1 pantoate--beta-alanine ligase [Pseudorhodoplanes sp.]MCL4710739.1 pantoate--beta-alanine ligase [Pseudorhodoplanes sp.]